MLFDDHSSARFKFGWKTNSSEPLSVIRDWCSVNFMAGQLEIAGSKLTICSIGGESP